MALADTNDWDRPSVCDTHAQTHALDDNVANKVSIKITIEFDRPMRLEGMITTCRPTSCIMITMIDIFPF